MPYLHRPRQTHKLPPRSRSGLKGVIHCPFLKHKQWKAYGRIHGQYLTLGYFPTREEAAREYDQWASRVKGPEAFLNRL